MWAITAGLISMVHITLSVFLSSELVCILSSGFWAVYCVYILKSVPHLPYFFNLAPEEFEPVFWETFCGFSVFSFGVLFLFFSLFVFFPPFCFNGVVWGVSSPFCSTFVACLSGTLPFFFIKKRGVVLMVFLLGGFFSSLRFTLLITKKNTWTTIISHYETNNFSTKFYKYEPVQLLEANHVVRNRTASLFYDISNAVKKMQQILVIRNGACNKKKY